MLDTHREAPQNFPASDSDDLGAARPVLGVAFGAERLDGRRPAALADNRLPGVRGCFGDGCHCIFRTGVPKVYRVTQGLTEENFYLVDKYGGQGWNRTTDTGIFRPV